MDHRQTLSIGFVILSLAVLVKSLSTATAFSGPSVSFAGNPVISTGGTTTNGTTLILTAPSNQRIVITDLLLSMNAVSCSTEIELTNNSGSILAAVKILAAKMESTYRGAYRYNQTQHAFKSGIPIDPGDSIYITDSSGCSVAYTLSGYHAQP